MDLARYIRSRHKCSDELDDNDLPRSTTVLIAGDDADAKASLAAIIEAGRLRAVDAGSLTRAHELEALGFLQLTLAAGNKTSWTSGFALAE